MKVEQIVYYSTAALVVGIFLFFVIVQDLGRPAQPTTVLETDKVVAGKKLVFGDEFDTQTLNSKNWTTCYDWRRPSETGCTNHGNFEQQWYIPEQVQVKDGFLVLTAQKKAVDAAVQDKVKSFAYVSGMVNSGSGDTGTNVRWAGTYGYYEAKIKFQKGQGVWPAFWLLPVDRTWPPEIDIMEFIGHKPDEILQTVHWQDGDKPAKSDVVIKGQQEYSDGWHTYAVDWRPDGIDWYIDGNKTRSYTGGNVPDKPMAIILNLAIGGLLPGNADETTQFPREMLVDYVRVYQSEDQIRPYQY